MGGAIHARYDTPHKALTMRKAIQENDVAFNPKLSYSPPVPRRPHRLGQHHRTL